MMTCRCSECAPRFDDIRNIIFKHNYKAMYIGDFLGLKPFPLYEPHITQYTYTVIPFFLPEPEIVIGLTYSGEKRFDPCNLETLSNHIFDVTIAKIFHDRILSCGGIKQSQMLSPSERLRTFVLAGPMISFLHDNNIQCYSNTTYIPLSDQEVATVGIILGRLSKSHDVEVNEYKYSIDFFKRLRVYGEESLVPKKRVLRYPICRIYAGDIECRIVSMEVLIPDYLDKSLPSEGASGLYVLMRLRSNSPQNVLTRALEIFELGNSSLYKLFLTNHAILLSYALNYVTNNQQHIYITNEMYIRISNKLIQCIKKIMPYTIHITVNTFLEGLNSLEENNYILMDRNKNGFYWLSYRHSRNITYLKSKYPYELLKSFMQGSRISISYPNSSRNIIVQSLKKGCYIAI